MVKNSNCRCNGQSWMFAWADDEMQWWLEDYQFPNAAFFIYRIFCMSSLHSKSLKDMGRIELHPSKSNTESQFRLKSGTVLATSVHCAECALTIWLARIAVPACWPAQLWAPPSPGPGSYTPPNSSQPLLLKTIFFLLPEVWIIFYNEPSRSS